MENIDSVLSTVRSMGLKKERTGPFARWFAHVQGLFHSYCHHLLLGYHYFTMNCHHSPLSNFPLYDLFLPNPFSPHCWINLTITTFDSLAIFFKTHNWTFNVGKIRSELLNLAFCLELALASVPTQAYPQGWWDLIIGGSSTDQLERVWLWTACIAWLGCAG